MWIAIHYSQPVLTLPRRQTTTHKVIRPPTGGKQLLNLSPLIRLKCLLTANTHTESKSIVNIRLAKPLRWHCQTARLYGKSKWLLTISCRRIQYCVHCKSCTSQITRHAPDTRYSNWLETIILAGFQSIKLYSHTDKITHCPPQVCLFSPTITSRKTTS